MKPLTILFALIVAFISTSLGYFIGGIAKTGNFYNKRYERQQRILDEVNESGIFSKKITHVNTSDGYALTEIDEDDPEREAIIYALVNSYVRRMVDGELTE